METVKMQTKRTFPEVEKMRFVREILSTRMSKAGFAQMHNIDRKALGRWIDKYGVYTDQTEHTARRFSAWLPPIQCTLSGHQCMMLIQV